MPPFNVISRRTTPEIVLKKKSLFQNSVSKVANWIIVDFLKCDYCVVLAISFTEMCSFSYFFH